MVKQDTDSMNVALFGKKYAVVLAILLVVDGAWLFAMRGVYGDLLSGLMRAQVLWVPAIVVWALLALGIVLFTLQRPWWYASLFGLISYGVYDFTNLATLAGWPLLIVAVDVCWGVVVCTIVRLIGGKVFNG